MKYVLFAPYREMVTLAEEVCIELGFTDWHIECCSSMKDCLKHALCYVEQGAEAIVSRGITADTLEMNLDIPIIRIATSPYDIIPLLSQLTGAPQQIGIIGFPLSIYGIAVLNDSFCHTLTEFPLASLKEIPYTIRRAKDMGIKTIIGGKVTVAEAKKVGLNELLFQSGKSSIAAALTHAINIVEKQHRKRAKIDWLNLLLELYSSGIILTDSFGKIILANKLATTMLCHKTTTLIGTDIKDIIPDLTPISNTDTAASRETKDAFLQAGNNHLMYNISPIRTDGKVTENIILLQYVKEIEPPADIAQKQLTKKGLVAKFKFHDILTNSPAMMNTILQAKKYAPVDSTILITGQTGTGKEMLAQSIHNASRRRFGPFVAINCASIPTSLLESELFGYESGAFSGARKNGKKGYFELANGGTLFLDEIGEIPISLQSTFLRVLQEHAIIRIGGDRVIPVDIRIICATHQDLQKACQENRFRLDLYHRLNILRLKVPTLNERIEDIPLLSEVLIRRKAEQLRLNPIILSPEVIHQLQLKYWSGNVRELEDIIERLVVLKSGNVVYLEEFKDLFADESFDFPKETESAFPTVNTAHPSLKELERQNIMTAYKKYNGDRTKICAELSVSKTTLWRRLKEYGIMT